MISSVESVCPIRLAYLSSDDTLEMSMIYIISCRNSVFKSIRGSRAKWGFALEVGAYLAHFVYLLRELQRLHGELVQGAQFVVFAASAQSPFDVLQLALEP